MSSREVRRAAEKKKKNNTHKEHDSGVKKRGKPAIYALSVLLLIVIVVAFIVLPMGNIFTNQSNSLVFGYYDKRPIQFIYGNYFSRQTQLLADQYQKEAASEDNYLGQIYQVWRGAFERTVVHEGILDTVEKSGLVVTEDLIDRRLVESGPYIVNGEFDEELYLQTPAAEKARNRDLFRESLKESQFMEDYFDNQLISDSEIEFIKDLSSPERNFRYVYFPFSDFPGEKVVEYGEENKKLFRRIKLGRITLDSSENEASQIHQQLEENPGLFSELAQAHSIDSLADMGGEMEWSMYYELEPDFNSEEELEKLFNLPIDGISDIIITEGTAADPSADTKTWTIYRIASPAVSPDLTDQDTLDTIRSYMTRYEGGMIEDFLIERAETFIANARDNDFMSAAVDEGLQPDMTDYFPINYGSSYLLKPVRSLTEQNILSGASFREDFFEEAFSLDENEISSPLILDRHIVVLQMIDERRPPAEELEQIDYYYSYVVRQIRDENLKQTFLESDKLEDDFFTAFNEVYEPNS